MSHWWIDYPWRFIQTNFREIDMESIDAVEYVKTLKEFNCNVVAINTGGIMASYDTDLEFQPRSTHMTGDTLSDLIDECHRAGIRVLARMDFSKTTREVYDKHPEWAYRNKEGQIMEYNGFVQTCFSGEYQQQKAFEITREVMNKLPIDGFYLNMGGYKTTDYSYRNYGLCQCENCKRAFRKMFGEELDEENLPKLKLFQERMYSQTIARLNSMIKSIDPEVALNGVDYQRIEAKTEFGKMGPEWMYNSASIARGGSTLEGVPRVSTSSVDFIGFYLRHSSVGPEIQKLRLYQAIANGGMLDYFIMGLLKDHRDKSSFAAVKDIFAYMAEHEEVYRGLKQRTDVLVIRQQSYVVSDENKGWIRALTENHISFGEVEMKFLTKDADLSHFKAVVLADVERVTDDIVALLDHYVENGGNLIVTGRSGLIDDSFLPRRRLPFRSLGTSSDAQVLTDQLSALFQINKRDRKILPSLSDTDILYIGNTYVRNSYGEQVEKHLSLIPPQPFGPPEICYAKEFSSEPGLTVNHYGKGQGIYIAWPVAERYYQDGYPSSQQLIHDVLISVAKVEKLDCGTLSPMVEVTVADRQDGSASLVHLVNTSGCMGKSYMAPLDINNVNISICTRKPTEVSSLGGGKVEYNWDGQMTHIKLDRLGGFEAILIKY